MRVLFLCMQMNSGFHGSMLHVLEYAEYFIQKNADVHIGSVFISEENRKIAEDRGIHVHSLRELPVDTKYDLVFALHLLLFPYMVCRDLKYDHAIAVTLSAFLPVEKVPPSPFWSCFDLMVCISDEIIDMYQKYFNINPKYFTRIPNHVPLRFYDHVNIKQEWNAEIKKICVVSNYYIPELSQLAELKTFEIDYYGSNYNNNVLITPDILLNYDVIITIGKTVQYGLSLGIPVFEYDHFGGCGYITLENINEEEKMNFSGRTTKLKMTAEEMILRLQSGYDRACAEAAELRTIACDRYAIDKLIEKQLAMLPRERAPRALSRDAHLFANACTAAINYIYYALDH